SVTIFVNAVPSVHFTFISIPSIPIYLTLIAISSIPQTDLHNNGPVGIPTTATPNRPTRLSIP
ncbi:hypothetical protein HK102_005846, partial [Quaeritorhiza haematococci]